MAAFKGTYIKLFMAGFVEAEMYALNFSNISGSDAKMLEAYASILS